MKDYDERRQELIDDGICHLCEGEGCPRCTFGTYHTPDTNDFEVHPSGTFKTLDQKDIEIVRLRAALYAIIDMKSCLLADAQAIAKEVLSDSGN